MTAEHALKTTSLMRIALILACVVICVAGLKAAEGIFVPVLLAFFVATVTYPVTQSMTKRGVPTVIAVTVTVLIDFAFIAGVVLLGVVLMQDLQEKWNHKYASQLQQQVSQTSEAVAGQLERFGVTDAKGKIQAAVQNNLKQLQQVRFESVWDVGAGVLGRLMGFFGVTLIFLILMVFMLLEADGFGRRLNAIHQADGPDIERMLETTRDIQRYLAIKTIISLATGIFAGLLCWAAGLDFYLLWGILAFALNFIPVIGSMVAGIPPTVLALLVGGWPNAIIVAGGYLLINNVLGNFLEPILVGRRFGISTLVVVVSVMFWGWVWGVCGMLLAVPLTMTIKVFLDNSDELRWLGVAIASGRATKKDAQPPITKALVIKPDKEEEVPR